MRQFALHYFAFNYQPRHAHNCFISQLRWYCAIIPMDEFRNINVLTTQLGTSLPRVNIRKEIQRRRC